MSADSRVVQRWDPDDGEFGIGMIGDSDGDYIKYADHLSLLAEAEKDRDDHKFAASTLHTNLIAAYAERDALQSRLDAALSTSGVDRALSATVGGEIVLSFITAQDECTAEEIIQSALRAALGCATTGERNES